METTGQLGRSTFQIDESAVVTFICISDLEKYLNGAFLVWHWLEAAAFALERMDGLKSVSIMSTFNYCFVCSISRYAFAVDIGQKLQLSQSARGIPMIDWADWHLGLKGLKVVREIVVPQRTAII